MGARGPLRSVPLDSNHTNPSQRGTEAGGAKAAPLPLPACPTWLPDSAKQQWRKMVKALDGLALAADGPALQMALAHWAIARKAAEELHEAEALATWDSAHERLAKHPASQVFRDHSQMFLGYAQQLGMTVVSRARIPTRQDQTDDGDGLFD